MIATVKIDTYLRNEITHLKSAYHTTPFKVAEIREDKNSPVLELMLMSSSPGILDGDAMILKSLFRKIVNWSSLPNPINASLL